MRRIRIRNNVPQVTRQLATRFREHEGISVNSIRRWLRQWEGRDINLAIKVLRQMHFYSARDIRTMLQQLVQRVYGELPEIPRHKVAFVPAGQPYSGAAVLGRALRDITGVERRQIMSVSELLETPDGGVEVVVIVEDFSGTGDTLEQWWYTIEPLILPKIPNIIFGLLVLNSTARGKLEQFTARLLRVSELTANDNVLSVESTTFEPAEKERLLQYCHRTGASENYCRGYGECGLLLALKHFCPNNSLPILWHRSNRWQNLFKRTAI